MKKILLLAPLTTIDWGTKNMGGVDSVCQMLIKRLESNPSNNFYYRVVAFDPTNSIEKEGEVIKINDRLEIVQFNMKKSSKSQFIKLPNLLYQLKVVKFQVRKYSPDLIHSHLTSWLMGLKVAQPTISTLHSYKKIARKPQGLFNDLLYEKIIPFLSPLYIKYYTSVSEFLKITIQSDINKKIDVIYNPIDEAYFYKNKIEKSSDEVVFVTCALLTPRKGIHHIIDIVFSIKQRGHRVKLKIIGPESDKIYVNNLKEQLKSKGLEKNVEFLGTKKTQEIVTIYSECDIGIFLSSEETFGLVPIEMLAANLPVQCLSTGVISDLDDGTKRNGLYIYDSINITKIADDAILLKEKVAEVDNRFIHDLFSVEKVVSDYESLYNKILNK
ncbi:VpsD family glycosyltransferase [Pseudoalteromonas issachenkonii]|uniref:VpsD family glycosyltransferase n=1 Tax=Pseudoalteromonas issachenkonii TaxID=152297 RepID=A0ABU9GYA9_9GAMM